MGEVSAEGQTAKSLTLTGVVHQHFKSWLVFLAVYWFVFYGSCMCSAVVLYVVLSLLANKDIS